ncbi:MAG: hypothetical protein FD122_552 [Stygiobacter sp.]|nr:MAG: hypothetical protein FD122_552 [Stygiobacter sp.]
MVDNSKSISAKDSIKRSEAINNLLSELSSEKALNLKVFSFGKKIDSLSSENPKLSFDEPLTNYSSLIDLFKKYEASVNSAVLVSDGIITEGADPSYQFEKMQFPLFTVGIGDSTTKHDVEIFDIKHNQFIYAGSQTKIQAIIRQNGFDGKQTRASLFEEGKLIDSKDILLSNSGINQVDFLYSPKDGGEKKLSVSLTPITGEFSQLNNSKTFFITVFDTKVKIALVSGSPSADVSAIAKALESDKNIQVNKFIQISRDKLWDNKKSNSLDSSSVLFLIDFPSTNTPQLLMNQVLAKIEKGTPFFISVSSANDFGKLKLFEKHLPFFIRSISQDAFQVQPEIQKNEFASSFSQIGNSITIWNNLPPVYQSSAEILPKPESKVIVKSKVRDAILNSPLITVRSIGNQRSFSINASNYWRWSLQTSEGNPDFFRNFINEIVKWLSLSGNKKQFTLTTNKKVYSPGEQVDLTAELYDNAFNPIDTAQIALSISQEGNKNELIMTPQGNGIYTASYTPDSQGDFISTANTKVNSISTIRATSRFSVSASSLELLDTKMRVDYLKLLANSTNGKYFSIEEQSNLLKNLIDAAKKRDEGILTKSEFELWNYSWMLGAVIFLFGFEWFLRKRFGMI